MSRFLASVVLVTMAAPLVQASDENVNIVRWSKGTVEYRNISDGKPTGREEWRITVHPDGSRTLSTTHWYGRESQQTVVLRVAENFRPLDLYSSSWYQGEWTGTGFISIDGNTLNAMASTPDGRVTQQVTIPDEFSFIPHPLQSNAWQMWAYDKSRGGPQESTVYDLMTRLKGPGNQLGPMKKSVATFLGRKQITVPAGAFEADHFKTASGVDMYLTGPDAILLKFIWPDAGQEYVLTTLESGQ